MKNIINRKILTSYCKIKDRELTACSLGGLMYTPAHNDRVSDFLTDRKYDHLHALALCLEDAIVPGSEKAAIAQISKTFSELEETIAEGTVTRDDLPYIFIRVRNPEQINEVYGAINGSNILTGFIFPKFDMSNARDYLGAVKKLNTDEKTVYAMPIIESRAVADIRSRVTSLLSLKDIVDAYHDMIVNIRIGGNDFCSQFGVRRSVTDTIYDISAVNAIIGDIVNVFAGDYIVSAPVWDYFEGADKTDTSWAEGMRRELHMDLINGLIGKTAIHPSQLKIIDDALSVSYEDYRDACDILNWNDSTLAVAKGSGGNRMNEAAVHKNWADKILIRAAVYGIKERERIITDIA